MKTIAIFRITFKPTPLQALSEMLITEINIQGQFMSAILTPFGVLSLLTTNKTVDEVKQMLTSRFAEFTFNVFEVTPPEHAQQAATENYRSMTLDELLDMINRVGGVANLPVEAARRLNELSGGH